MVLDNTTKVLMNERILIVEDEAIVLLDIRSRLAGLGYSIVGTASTGEEAIVKANATRPDAILMDIGLKGDIDGISAAETIRKTQDTPIIYLTANSDITTLQRAKITGPFGYVLKPFDERELRVTIEMALYKHRMDRDLNDARQWLTATLRNTGDGIIAIDESGVVKFLNTVAEALTGWELGEVAGKDFQSVFKVDHSDGTPFLLSYAKNASSGGFDKSIVAATLVNRDRRQVPVEYRHVPIQDDWGKVTGTVYIFKDIADKLRGVRDLTESQKLAEEKLAVAEEQIRVMMDMSPDAIFTCNLKGVIVDGNHASASILCLPKAELIGKNLFDTGILRDNETQKVASIFSKAMDSGMPCSEEVTFTGLDGQALSKTLKVIPLKKAAEPIVLVTVKQAV